MAATGSYRLDLDPPKRNVFVTQLNEREDDEDDIKAFPIVKENAAKLIETGINTLQKTLLLKKEVEVEKVDNELAAKREEFQQRMQSCSERQIEIQKKQQKMKDRVQKFEKFIKENEGKRRRAIQKYQTEVKMKEQKNIELVQVVEHLELLKARHAYLKTKLERYKMFEEYLNRVVEVLPAHYLEVNDSMLNSLMMRHRTLSETNQNLVDNLSNMADHIEEKKQELKEMQREHDKKKFSINSSLSQMKKQQETKEDKNEEQEQHFYMSKSELRHQRTEFGQIMMAIENLADKCRGRLDPALEDMDVDQKLQIVKEYINERSDVVKLVQRGNLSSASTNKKSRGPKT